ncbi:chondrolectin-like [Arapaima gigas]
MTFGVYWSSAVGARHLHERGRHARAATPVCACRASACASTPWRAALALQGVKMLVLLFCGATLLAGTCRGARLVSGQTICQGGAEQPCYKIAFFRDMSSRVAFREARQACEMDGGALLSVESQAEQQLIERLLQELSSSSSSAPGPGEADGDFWIGLTRTDREPQDYSNFASCPDLYRWTDGSTAQFRNWYSDEPSCGGEACVVMYHQPTAVTGPGGAYLYQWNDDRCNMKHNFICKYKPGIALCHQYKHSVAQHTNNNNNNNNNFHLFIGLLLIYVIIPTIPLLLLILVASGTCCFQMLSKSKPRTKTSANQTTLWISKTAKAENSMEV